MVPEYLNGSLPLAYALFYLTVDTLIAVSTFLIWYCETEDASVMQLAEDMMKLMLSGLPHRKSSIAVVICGAIQVGIFRTSPFPRILNRERGQRGGWNPVVKEREVYGRWEKRGWDVGFSKLCVGTGRIKRAQTPRAEPQRKGRAWSLVTRMPWLRNSTEV